MQPCCPLCIIIVGVLLFIEESCTTPMHSFLQELGMVRNRELKTCILSISIFHLLFLFFNIFISCLFFFFLKLAFGLWCSACYKLFWRKNLNPYTFDSFIFAYMFCNIIFLLVCKCFVILYLCLFCNFFIFVYL
jgi:hypothetical protein